VFTTVLTATQQAVLERLSAVPVVHTFYLAGGTGLALHLGHRRSVDFDFFRQEQFDPNRLLAELGSLGPGPVHQAQQDTLTVELRGVATSFFAYAPAPVRALVPSPWAFKIAAVEDIAAMKLGAIAGRGSRKDFIDLYCICRQRLPLAEALRVFDEKFRGVPYERYHLLKSLTYFDDAEAEPLPDMIASVPWKDVKAFFLREAPSLFA
jgi:hypothetical protein